MGAFPKDFEISVSRLFKLWIAAEYVRCKPEKDFEEVAEGYLSDLIGRSLIMVKKKTSSGKVKTCEVHDLLHDLILREVWKERSIYFAKSNVIVSPPVASFEHCIIFSFGFAPLTHIENVYDISSLPRESSLLCFERDGTPGSCSQVDSFISFTNFKWLTVLDMCFQLFDHLPSEIWELSQLRKVGLSPRNDSSTWFLLGSYYVYTLEDLVHKSSGTTFVQGCFGLFVLRPRICLPSPCGTTLNMGNHSFGENLDSSLVSQKVLLPVDMLNAGGIQQLVCHDPTFQASHNNDQNNDNNNINNIVNNRLLRTTKYLAEPMHTPTVPTQKVQSTYNNTRHILHPYLCNRPIPADRPRCILVIGDAHAGMNAKYTINITTHNNYPHQYHHHHNQPPAFPGINVISIVSSELEPGINIIIISFGLAGNQYHLNSILQTQTRIPNEFRVSVQKFVIGFGLLVQLIFGAVEVCIEIARLPNNHKGAKVSNFISAVNDSMVNECRSAMLNSDMTLARIMAHAQQIEEQNIKMREKQNKRAKTTSAPLPKFSEGNKDKMLGSKSQGSVSNAHTYPLSQTYGKHYQGIFRAGSGICFGCGKPGHRVRYYLLLGPSGQQDRSSALSDQGASLSFDTLYSSRFGVILEILAETFSVSTLVGKTIIAQQGKANVEANALSRLYMGSVAHADDSVDDLRQQILVEAHGVRYSIYPGATKMYLNLREIYWWSGIMRDVLEFMAKCSTCQQVKIEHQKPSCPMQEFISPTWKWEELNMDFVMGLPRTHHQHDSVWVIIDTMTKSSHFLLVHTSYSIKDYAKLYIRKLVKLHSVPLSIISDRDGQAERTIQTLENMLRACAIDFKGSWDDHFSLIEFAYNNSYHSSIKMSLFEALYGGRCRSPIGWSKVSEPSVIGTDLGVKRFGKKGKLSPRYVGPFKILSLFGKVAYELELPSDLASVHPVFHVSLLKKCIGDPTVVVPIQSIDVQNIKRFHSSREILGKKKPICVPSILTYSYPTQIKLKNERPTIIPSNLVANSAATRILNFTSMNPPSFLGFKSNEDPQEFLDQVQKVTYIMGVNFSESAELAAYQLQDVAHTRFKQLITHAQQIKEKEIKMREQQNKRAKTDPGASLSFVTPYIDVDFRVSPKILAEPFSVSTPMRKTIIAQWFVEGFSSIASLMSRLTQKKVMFLWSDPFEKSFQDLKARLTSAPVLALPDGSDGFVVYCDTSRVGLGCVLMHYGQCSGRRSYRLYMGSVAHMDDSKKKLAQEVHQLSRLGIHLVDTDEGDIWVQSSSKSSLVSETDGQAEMTIQTLENMIRACAIDFRGSWDDHFSLIEFAYNNSYYYSIKMAPFEALYGRRYRSLIDVRRKDLKFEIGDYVYLKISPMKGVNRFGKKGKLSPRYVGPFKILSCFGKVAYELKLPSDLASVHPVFHVSLLKKCIGDPTVVVPIQSIDV
ncbi:hypothetical protein FXO37_12888 [Capsicum annuum]|nr:hypothetical protein FXO37_12888 [Capsicum annuum]